MVTIPTRSDIPRYTQVVELDGTSFKIKLDFNTRTDSWVFSILTLEDVEILSGVRLTANWDVFKGHSHLAALPPGKLILQDTTGGDADPTSTSLGSQHKLIYITEAEVTAAS